MDFILHFIDLRSELERLSVKLQQTDSNYNTVCEAQQQYEFTCAKYNKKLKSAQAVIEEQITPEKGLSVMEERMTSLQVRRGLIYNMLSCIIKRLRSLSHNIGSFKMICHDN